MREKVLSTREYRGFTIEHVESERFRSGVPFRGDYYQKVRMWWIAELEWDEPTLREAKVHIDEALEARLNGG